MTYEEAFKSVSDLLDSVMVESGDNNNEEVVEESARTAETKACKNALKEAKSNMKQAVGKLASDPERALQLLNVAETKLDDAEAAFDRIPKENIIGVVIIDILKVFEDYIKSLIILFTGGLIRDHLGLKNKTVTDSDGNDKMIPHSDIATKSSIKIAEVRALVVNAKRIAGLITRFKEEDFSMDLFNSAKNEIKSSIKATKGACKALEKVAMKSAKKSDKSVKESVNELKVKTYEALHENKLTQEAADDILLQLDLMLIQSNEL